MNRENAQDRSSLGRGVLAAGLGMLLAMVSPASLLFSALVLVFIYRWAGLWPTLLTAVFQLLGGVRYMGTTYAWVALLTTLLPVALLLASEKKPFFTQLKLGIGGFCGGMLAVVGALYAMYGSNLIERLMMQLLDMLRAVPRDAVGEMLKMISGTASVSLTVDSYYQFVEQTVEYLIPLMQRNLLGMLLSMALVSGVFCTWLNARLARRNGAGKGAYVPLREWFMPASTTLGLALMIAAGFALEAAGFAPGDAALQTVLYLALTAFSIQAFCSVQRRCHAAQMQPARRVGITLIVAVFCLMGALNIVASYGFMSALLGSNGALKQYLNNKKNNSQTDGEE